MGIAITAKGRAPAADGFAQDLRGDGCDSFDLGAGHPTATAGGAYARAKEDFGGVDIADPSYDTLIHQEIFDCGGTSARRDPEAICGEAVEGFGSQALEFNRTLEGGLGVKLHQAEAAGIVVDQEAAVVKIKLDVVVARVEWTGVGWGVTMAQAAAHAEMDKHPMCATEGENQIFGAAIEPFNFTTGNSGREIGRKAAAQAWLANAGGNEDASDE